MGISVNVTTGADKEADFGKLSPSAADPNGNKRRPMGVFNMRGSERYFGLTLGPILRSYLLK
jgi:hypothetical protein